MKKISGIIDVLKMALKYSAYILVFVDIVSYAISKVEALQNDQNEKESETKK